MTPPSRKRPLRRIAVITGTRAEYGLLKSPMTAIQRTPGLKLQVIATGMHWLSRFGSTHKEITADGFRIDKAVRMQKGDDSPTDQAVGLAKGIRGVADFLHSQKSDIAVVLGDRIEAMAAALAAVTTGTILAHIHGGDVAPGDFDDSFRHAITKLAHIHFAATHAAARRIRGMGESVDRIFVVGAPGLDRLTELAWAKRPINLRRAGKKTALILFHASGRAKSTERRAMKMILRCVGEAGLAPTIVYPNSDRGHEGVLDAILQYGSVDKRAKIVRSFGRDEFLRQLLATDMIIGNSSCGIIEAPWAGTPSVNVGTRQQGREVGGTSVIHALETAASVRLAIAAAFRKRTRRRGSDKYGQGTAGKQIAKVLASINLTERLRHKTLGQ